MRSGADARAVTAPAATPHMLMSRDRIKPTGVEVSFGDEEIIVSKTDRRGIITYANDVFQRVSGFSEQELLGQPHNLIRHPQMPRCVFRLLWETLEAGREIFAYVINLARDGRHYWVFAHVTPSFDRAGQIVGYHSNRRVPDADALVKVKELYAALLAEETRWPDPRVAIEASTRLLTDLLQRNQVNYSEFVFSLSQQTRLGAAA